MAIRCKLISPTTILLEHPMLSPVAETEFVVMGVKEWKKKLNEALYYGVWAGMALALILSIAMVAIAGILKTHS